MNNASLTELGFTHKYLPLDKKRKCTNCRTKMVDGTPVSMVFNHNDKIKGYFCSEQCYRNWNP